MARDRFCLKTLPRLDGGRIAAMFDALLERCVADCEDRPDDKKPREVVLRLRFVPELDRDSKTCRDVTMAADVRSRVPAMKSYEYTMEPLQDGGLAFNADLPDDPRGTTLFDDQEREEDAQP